MVFLEKEVSGDLLEDNSSRDFPLIIIPSPYLIVPTEGTWTPRKGIAPFERRPFSFNSQETTTLDETLNSDSRPKQKSSVLKRAAASALLGLSLLFPQYDVKAENYLGDLNNDGAVTVGDAQEEINTILGRTTNENADLNADGAENILDLQEIREGVSGALETFKKDFVDHR